MSSPLLTIAIPTYNRAGFLKNLLDGIVLQAEVLAGVVQICISNNASTDNTRVLVMGYMEKYPGLITYNENRENLGLDKNLMKVMEMANGKFTWMMGDDDTVVAAGVGKVVDVIKNNNNEHTGLVIVGHQTYCADPASGKKTIYFSGIDGQRPRVYAMDVKNIMGMRLDFCFLSVLIFNSFFLKKTLQEEKIVLQKAIGNHYIHTFLYQLMFLNHPELQVIKYNEKIVESDVHYYKFYIEDMFELYYTARVALSDLLLEKKSIHPDYKKAVLTQKNKFVAGFVRDMAAAKAFSQFNYISFFGCMAFFFKKTNLARAAFFSLYFVIISTLPPFLLKSAYKTFIKTKYAGSWQNIWLAIVVRYGQMSQGSQRVIR